MLTDLVTQLKNSTTHLQTCDVEIDNEDLTVSEFSYSNSWGVSVSINSTVEVEYINGVPARKWLVIEEETFDEIIDKLEIAIGDADKLDRVQHNLDRIEAAANSIRNILGVSNADNS